MDFIEKNKWIRDLYFKQFKTYREIAKITHTSPKQIKQILDNEKQKIFHDRVIEMIENGNTIKEITIELDLNKDQIEKVWEQYLSYNHKDTLLQLYSKIKDSPDNFLKFSYHLYQKNLKPSELEELISIHKEIHEYLLVHQSLLKQSDVLTNEISIKQQIKSKLDEEIKLKKSEVQKLEDKKTSSEESLQKVKVDLYRERLLKTLLENNHNYAILKKKFLEGLNNDEELDDLILNIFAVVVDNLGPYALCDKEELIQKLPRLYEYLFINNYDDFLESLSYNEIEDRIVKACKEIIKNCHLIRDFNNGT